MAKIEKTDSSTCNFHTLLAEMQDGAITLENSFQKFLKKLNMGLPWWSSGSDSMLPRQGAQVQFLVRELGPSCRNQEIHMLQVCLHPQLKKILCATNKTCNSQINTFFKKLNIHLLICEPAIGGSVRKESNLQCRRHRRRGFDPWVRKITWRRKRQPNPVFLPGESHGQRSLAGYSSWDHKELDMTEAT